jgi:hypothetical protein
MGGHTKETANSGSIKDAIGTHANATVTVPTIVNARISVVKEEVRERAEIAQFTRGSMVMEASTMTTAAGDITAIVIAMVTIIVPQLNILVEQYWSCTSNRLEM